MRRFAVFALTAALAAAPAARAADVDPLLPKETEQVVFVNVKQMMESDLFKTFAKKQVEEMLKQGEAKAVLEMLGLDPMKDIGTITAGAWGDNPENMSLVAVVRGSFDADKILKTAEQVAPQSGGKLSMVEEGDFKLMKMIGDNDKPFFASVADGKTMVVGTDKKTVATSLKANKDRAKPALSKELTALMAKQDEKASMFLCGVLGDKLAALPIPDDLGQLPIKGADLKKQLAAVTDLSITIRATKDATLDLTLGVKDAESAAGLGKTAEQLVNLAKILPLLLAQQEQLKPLLPIINEGVNSLKAKATKSDVTLSLKITGDAIGKAVKGDQ